MASPIATNIGINTEFVKPILAGLIELTNGVKLVSESSIVNYNLSIILSAFLLGFGGISVLLQVSSIVAKTDLSMKKYVIGKLLQGVIASVYVFFILNFIPNFEIQSINIKFILSAILLVVLIILAGIIIKNFLQKNMQTKKL